MRKIGKRSPRTGTRSLQNNIRSTEKSANTNIDSLTFSFVFYFLFFGWLPQLLIIKANPLFLRDDGLVCKRIEF